MSTPFPGDLPSGMAGAAHPAGATRTRQLCLECVRLLPVQGAVIAVLGVTGVREAVFSTDSVAQQLDELQFQLGEGPCIDAYRDGEPVLIGDLSSDRSLARWPGFSPAATQAGAAAAFAFPLQAGPVRLGVMELYGSGPGELTDRDRATASQMAGSATTAVLADLSIELARGVPGLLGGSGRADVHRACGMIAAQLDVSIPEAMSRLRASAYAEQVPILQVAREVLSRARTFEPEDGAP